MEFHIGTLKRAFETGFINENRVENTNETQVIFKLDNGKTLGIYGEQNVKYADVVSSGEPITIMVSITGGKSAMIQHPCSYSKIGHARILSRVLQVIYPAFDTVQAQMDGWIHPCGMPRLHNHANLKHCHTGNSA